MLIGSFVFYKMFYGDLLEKSDLIEFVDVDLGSLLEFFCFMYFDEINLIVSCVFCVMYLVEKYMVFVLFDECVKFLKNEINVENIWEILR